MTSDNQRDSERQRLLVDALDSIEPREVSAAAFRNDNLADVPKGSVRKLLTDHPNVRIRDEAGKTYYAYAAEPTPKQAS